jgi:hypothetical protein
MPTWPTNKPDSTYFDNADDAISNSRAEIKTMSDAVNDVVDFIQPSGITNGQGLIYDSGTATMVPGSVGGGVTNYRDLTFSVSTYSVTANTNPSSAPTVNLVAASTIHKINVGTNNSSGADAYIDVNFDNLNLYMTYTVYVYGVLNFSNHKFVVIPHDGASVLDLSDGSTQYIFPTDGLERFGFQITKVDTSNNRYLVVGPNGTFIYDI